jgi:hypothetical protein
MNARRDLYAELMAGGPHSPDRSEKASALIEAFAAEHRAEATTPLVVDRYDVAMEAAPEEELGLTIGAVAEDGRPVALVFGGEARLKVAGWLTPVVELEQELAEARARVAELETDLAEQKRTTEYFSDQSQRRKTERNEARAELAKYVGAEPTIAEEMAHLGACLRAVDALSLPENLKVDTITADYRIGYIHALADMRTALEAPERTSYPPAFPWAALMDDEDLAEFLAELEHAIATPGATPNEALTAVEKACGTWRAIAETQHAHNTAAGPDTTGGTP